MLQVKCIICKKAQRNPTKNYPLALILFIIFETQKKQSDELYSGYQAMINLFSDSNNIDDVIKSCVDKSRTEFQFIDPEFPFGDEKKNLTWMKPRDYMHKNVTKTVPISLFSNKIQHVDSTDVSQGKLGNCWLIAGLSVIAEMSSIKTEQKTSYIINIFRTCLDRETREKEQRLGIYRLTINKDGLWKITFDGKIQNPI